MKFYYTVYAKPIIDSNGTLIGSSIESITLGSHRNLINHPFIAEEILRHDYNIHPSAIINIIEVKD